MAMNLLFRVIQRRLARGEDLDAVLRDYPKLTEEGRKLLEKTVRK